MARHKRPDVNPATVDALVDRLRHFETLVEVGIGERHDVAVRLAAHGKVTGTDIVARRPPGEVGFVRDDITQPTPGVYHDADVLYAINLPPELHQATLTVARDADAAFAFTTVGGELPAVSVTPEALTGETLYWAHV